MHNYLLNVGINTRSCQNPIAPLFGQPNGIFYENSAVESRRSPTACRTRSPITESDPFRARDTFANDPLGGFVITGNNKTTGPPISSDADYQPLRGPGSHARFPGDPGQQMALWGTGAQPVQPSQDAQRSPGRLPRRPAP